MTLTRRPLCLLSYRGEVRSAGVEPAKTWLSTKPVYQICGTSAWSLWTDSNGLLRVTTPVLCRVSYRGMAAHRGFEPRLPDPESSVLPVGRMGIECGRCDSNAHTARFELARSRRLPSLPHGAPPGT